MSDPSRRLVGATVGAGFTRFEVWAPRADRVEVVLDDRRVDLLPDTEPADGTTTWVGAVSDVGDGDRYLISLDGGDALADPASRHQPDGVHGRSAVVDTRAFTWSDDDWTGVPLDDAVIYELHVGTFTPDGTFDAAIGELDRLAGVGVTVIEVMPVNAFPGERNWGYDGVFTFATQASYGGPAAFARFVDAAHRRGLAVILDVVYNHFGPEGSVLARYAPYFTDDYRSPWGDGINVAGPGSDGVRRFFTDNVRYWIAELHLDGFRMDAVHAIVDPTARPIIGELVAAARDAGSAAGRSVLVTLESAANDPRMVRPVDRGGLGADAMWNDDVHHALRVALTGEQHEYYAAFDGVADLARALERNQVYDGQHSPTIGRRHGAPGLDVAPHRFVVFSSNHDHVGNTPSGQRLLADAAPDDPRHRLAAAFVLLSPFTPLLFMGEEYGETAPFPYVVDHGDPELVEAVRQGRRREFADHDWAGEVVDPSDPDTFRSAVLDPSVVARPIHTARQAMYTELIALRRQHQPVLAAPTDRRHVRLAGSLLTFTRTHSGDALVLTCNFSPEPVDVPASGSTLFDTDDPRWCGDPSSPTPTPRSMAPWSARLSRPA